MTPTQHRVLDAIRSLSDAGGHYGGGPSLVASRARLSNPRTASRAIAALVEAGEIEIVEPHRGTRPALLRLTRPAAKSSLEERVELLEDMVSRLDEQVSVLIQERIVRAETSAKRARAFRGREADHFEDFNQ
jgi:hypothetical protein